MALYLSKVISDRKSEHPLLKERGIEFRTLAPLKDLNIHGVVLEPEVAYGGYVANISAFVTATNLKTTIAVSNGTYGFVYNTHQIMWTPPRPVRVSFAVNRILKDNQRNGLRNKFERGGLEFFNAGQFTKVIINHPDDEICQSLLPLSADFSRSDPSELMVKAWHPYRVLVLLINNFLATNSYPAFRDRDESSRAHEYTLLVKEVLRQVEEEAQDLDVDLDMEDDESERASAGVTKITGASLYEAVLSAKPSPLPASNNFGPPSSVPNLPGIFFPHFHRMIIPDYVTIPKFVMSTFFKYFGDTFDEAKDFSRRIDQAWSSLAGTDVGNIVGHCLYGIKLSLQTQSRLYVVQSGTEYHGFCLLGERFRVFDGNSYVAPVSSDELRITISSHCSDHAYAVDKLSVALSSVSLKDGSKVEVGVEAITGGLSVMKLVDERIWSDEEKEELVEVIGKLNFQRSFWGTRHQSIISAIKLITVDSATPLNDSDYPAYPGPEIELYGSRAYRVLSFFGPNSFSFIDRQGKGYDIPAMNQDDPLSKIVDGKMEMDTLHVGLKRLSEAHRDWMDVVKNGQVMFRAGERASKYRKMVFSGDSRNQLWKALRTYVAPIVDADVTPPPVTGPVKRASKRAAVDVDDLISEMLGTSEKRSKK